MGLVILQHLDSSSLDGSLLDLFIAIFLALPIPGNSNEQGSASAMNCSNALLYNMSHGYLWVKPLDGSDGVTATPTTDSKKNFSITNRFSRTRSRALHVRSFLRQKQIILSLVYQVSTRLVWLDEKVRANCPNLKRKREKRVMRSFFNAPYGVNVTVDKIVIITHTNIFHGWYFWHGPGPASTVGERPPTNPAIRVRFPPETLLLSRRFTQFYARPRFIARAKRRRRHLLETKSILQLSLCIKGKRSPENWSYDVIFVVERRHTNLTTQHYTNLQWF